ncbi:MAG: hypothetical protein D6712_19665, partial [Chloroflexi bacterium]
IAICTDDGKVYKSFPDEGVFARAATNYDPIGEAYDVPFYRRTFGHLTFVRKDGTEVEFSPEDGETYIVSGLVLEVLQEYLNKRGIRSLAVAPAETVRDNNGRPIGAKGLVVAPNAPSEVVEELIG